PGADRRRARAIVEDAVDRGCRAAAGVGRAGKRSAGAAVGVMEAGTRVGGRWVRRAGEREVLAGWALGHGPCRWERRGRGDVVDGDGRGVFGEAAVLVDDLGADRRRARAIVEDAVDRGCRAAAGVGRAGKRSAGAAVGVMEAGTRVGGRWVRRAGEREVLAGWALGHGPCRWERRGRGDVVDGDGRGVFGEAAVLVDDPGADRRRARAIVEDAVDRGCRAAAGGGRAGKRSAGAA